MRSYNLWEDYRNVQNFKILSQSEKNRILNLLLDKNAPKLYYVDSMINTLKGQVDNQIFIKLANNFIINGKGANMRSVHAIQITEELIKLEPQKTKKLLFESNSSTLNKLLLLYNDNSLEEEIKGLRAISFGKYIPKEIHCIKYKPKFEALEKLPPIMRLKTLEALLTGRKLKYNIFENISENDFKSLLFTSSLKHTGRVETVYNKYSELKHMGTKSTVRISACCNYCENYEINITSVIIRTKTGMKNTALGKSLLRKYCPFCYTKLSQKPIFIEGK